MEVGGALASVLVAAFSLPCLLLLLALGEAGLRVAALALRGDGRYVRPSRNAFLGYHITRPGAAAGGSYSASVFWKDDEPPLPPECCDRLAVAVQRRRREQGQVPEPEPECVFCLSAVRDGEEVRELRCRHVFHRACLDAWLVRPRATCPLCRDRLLPTDQPHARYAAAADDVEYFVNDDRDRDHDHDHDHDHSSSSSAPASASAPGGALWHVTT